ncbi:MAG: caudovirus prohead protease, partial [Paenisporosarcina sp.]
MEADFSGYATKAGLKCSDGRTIMPDAFKHQDTSKVPLVWQHGHNDPENVLGHAILENRADGVYAYGFFNKSSKADHAHALIEHGDINMMSIWANDLIERAGRVLHGAIREVSLVLSGANPGALIENVTIRHSDGDMDTLNDEAIIYTGLTLEHSSTQEEEVKEEVKEEEPKKVDEVKEVEEIKEDDVQHAVGDDETVQDVYDSMTDKQKQVLHFMIGEALASAGSVKQDNVGDDTTTNDDTKGSTMKHNVFENKEGEKEVHVLSHDAIKGIVADAVKTGSLKEAVENYALSHGIEDIDVLFPDAHAIDNVPEFLKRRTEWVASFLGATRKSPFSRIKTLNADITVEQARAKGYVKGTLKKEEFFGVARRVTTPTTVYKKQKLDRDDMVDITDFDVVAWLKAEMRLMLDEELARAVLIGDGRDVDDEDKIKDPMGANEGAGIRSILHEHDLYATTVTVDDA